MKKNLLLLMLCTSFWCSAQQFSPPNYAKIKVASTSAASPYYYPKVLHKFLQADETMSLEEKRHLYYGHIHQEHYSPYSRSDYIDSLNAVLKIKKMEIKHYHQLIRYSDSLLVDNPFNLNAYNYKSYAYNHLKEEAQSHKVFIQKKIIIDALLSSGDGLTESTPFYITNTNHQHFLLHYLDLEFTGSQSVIDDLEYLSVHENEKEIDGLYFNVSAISSHMSNLFQNTP